ncbi:MAG: SapC family protein [Burkholderiales bacterium]
MPTLLFYNKPVLLNREAHRNLKLRAVPSFAFAAATNSVPLSGIEFAAAARQMPIVFINDANQQPAPIALLGLRKDENLFIDADGRWDGSYVPAFIRRYPYVLGDKGLPDEFNVCIDEEFPGFNTEEGDPLFNEDGSESDALKRAMDFLNAYQADAKRTQAFCAELNRLDLLVPQVITVNLKDGKKSNLDGFSLVDEKRLAQLSDADAGNLLRSGYLGWIYAHLLSTHNVNELARRLDPRMTETRKSA